MLPAMIDGELLTYHDVARLGQVHPRTVQRWVKRLNLRVVRPSQCTVLLPRATVDRLLGREVDYGAVSAPPKRPKKSHPSPAVPRRVSA